MTPVLVIGETELNWRIAVAVLAIGALLGLVRGPIAIIRARFAKLQPRPGEFEEEEMEPALLKVCAALVAGAVVIYLTFLRQ
jgi:hypothetical protein